MAWAKFDDGFDQNPRILALSDAAFRAYVSAILYCNRNLTDGFVPERIAAQLADKKTIAELTKLRASTDPKKLPSSLWEAGEDGFCIHDYLNQQPTREKVLEEREAAKRRMKAVRSGNVRANNG